MKRVLVTGVRGFTGRYVREALLSKGYEVYGLSHYGCEDIPGVFACDLLDKNQVRRVVDQLQPEYVIHLAAISFVAHDDVDLIYSTNILGTRNLLEALDRSGTNLSKVLIASSANIYGNSLDDPIREDVGPSPVNDYAVSKMAMEAMANLWIERLPLVIVRPFNYTGVGQGLNFLLPKIVGHYRRKAEVLELGNLDVERDFSDVRWVADVYVRLLEVEVVGQTLNVCSGTSISLKHVLDIMTQISGHNIDVAVNQEFVRSNEIRRLRGCNRNLKNVIGPSDGISVLETLKWMYSS
jgi:nucleoside-diphosphate-sugar epimerase